MLPYTLYQKRHEEITPDPGRLDAAERARYQRLRDPRKQAEFLAGRCFLKEVLGEQLGIPPATVSLSLTPNGRPYLPAIYGPGAPWFSLAHARGRYLVGLSRRPIGVDLEPIRPVPPTDLSPFFHPGELEELRRLPRDQQAREGLRLFTLKEAFIKAVDRQWGLDQIAFSRTGDGQWRLSRPGGVFHFTRWEENDTLFAVCLAM